MWVASIRVQLLLMLIFMMQYEEEKWKRIRICSSLITTLIHRTLINYVVIKRLDCSHNYAIIKKRAKVVNLAQNVHHLHEKMLHNR